MLRIMLAHNYNFDVRKLLPQETRGFQAIEPRHTYVQEHHVGPGFLDGLENQASVRNFAAKFAGRLAGQQADDAPAHQLIIVGNKDTQGCERFAK